MFFEPEHLHDLHVDLSNPHRLRHIYPEYLSDASILRHPYHELVLDAGDVVYAPPGWPHFVENLETSVSVTENFRGQFGRAARTGETAVETLPTHY